MYAITVIIPTYNRALILKDTLAAYSRQSVRKDVFEVIVVDDGSSDETASIISKKASSLGYHLRFFSQSNKGPGQARNWAISEAAAPLVLITGDDIIPHENMLWEHLLKHHQAPSQFRAVLGKVEWDPRIPISFFMHFITEISNYQFGFHQITNPESTSFRFFYTSNISLKTEFLRSQAGFHPDFLHAAYEDIELGREMVGGLLYKDANKVLSDGTANDLIWAAMEEAKRRARELKTKFMELEVDNIAV